MTGEDNMGGGPVVLVVFLSNSGKGWSMNRYAKCWPRPALSFVDNEYYIWYRLN